jgi:hypothetical protein
MHSCAEATIPFAVTPHATAQNPSPYAYPKPNKRQLNGRHGDFFRLHEPGDVDDLCRFQISAFETRLKSSSVNTMYRLLSYSYPVTIRSRATSLPRSLLSR